MIHFDMQYIYMVMIPSLIISLIAQWKVKSAFAKNSKIGTSSDMSGAEAAQAMLNAAGIGDRVGIERVEGFLSDHYDPRTKVLRLSPDVYDGRSLSSVGVACHEAGHAMQDATHYAPLVVRNAIVPTANFGFQGSYFLIFLGMIFRFPPLLVLGVALFGTFVVFQLVNLIPEFNASARAKHMLVETGIIQRGPESAGVAEVLDAAAMTYVAATITAILTFLYYLSLLTGNRRN